jgi:hypothetical protein
MAAIQTQIRRDTATNLNAATPASGELGYDTTNKRAVVGDGSTAGGIRIPSAKDVQNNTFTYGTVGGTANAITLTHSPVVLAYAAGQEFVFKATSSNSGATTVNVDSLGTKNIYKLSNGSLGALTGSEIISGVVYTIAYDGTQFQLKSAGGSGSVVVQQLFTVNGTYTPTAGMLYCIVEAVGGGGGAGSSGTTTRWGGGGGGGEYVRSRLTAAQIGASKAVTIGAGGTGGVSGNGADGGDTSLGILVVATKGLGGIANAGSGSLGGDGGSGGTGDFKTPGQAGQPGTAVSGVYSGAGGSSYLGFGGRPVISAGAGSAGQNYGAGGSGGNNGNGGAGSSGVIIITEYCSG